MENVENAENAKYGHARTLWRHGVEVLSDGLSAGLSDGLSTLDQRNVDTIVTEELHDIIGTIIRGVGVTDHTDNS